MKWRRYQCKKIQLVNLRRGHPWLFKKHFSSAIEALPDGCFLKLVDDQNQVVGTAILDKKSSHILARVLHLGKNECDADFVKQKLVKVINKRRSLIAETNCIRWVHGDNDFFPGVTLDQYGDTLVAQVYGDVFRPMALFLGKSIIGLRLAGEIKFKNLLLKSAYQSHASNKTRVICGEREGMLIEAFEKVGENNLARYFVDALDGQKGGHFNDLRGVRRHISRLDLKEYRVLNLFCGTGTLSFASVLSGAKEVVSIDKGQSSLDIAMRSCETFYAKEKDKVHWLEADLFKQDWEAEEGTFDLVIIDPPNLASKSNQVKFALKKWVDLHQKALKALRPGGSFISVCCTSRFTLDQYFKKTKEAAKAVFPEKKFTAENIPLEIDHPALSAFPEGNYFKSYHWHPKN